MRAEKRMQRIAALLANGPLPSFAAINQIGAETLGIRVHAQIYRSLTSMARNDNSVHQVLRDAKR